MTGPQTLPIASFSSRGARLERTGGDALPVRLLMTGKGLS